MKQRLLTLLIVSFTCACYSQKAYQPELRNENYKLVIVKAKKALKINKTDSIANYVLGLSYTNLQQYNEAIKHLNLAKQNGLNIFPVQLNLAKNYTKTRQIEKAITELENASKTGRLTLAQIDNSEFESLKLHQNYKKVRLQVYNSIYPCKLDENYRRFDFWVGDWEVFANDQKIAESTISLTNGDCGILENYRPLNGGAGGNSISYYDSTDKKWKQNWVARGRVSHYIESDSLTKGDMQIIAEAKTQKGVKYLLRMSYFNNVDNTVRQLMERSIDNGKIWSPVYDGLYKPKVEKKMTNHVEIKKEKLERGKLIYGKEFIGSYENTPKHIEEVKSKLESINYYYKPLNAVSIYLSDPLTEKENKLKSFHGHIVTEKRDIEPPFKIIEMNSGEYLVSATKDKSLMNSLYGEAFKHAAVNKIKLSENESPVLITTADESGNPIFSIYFKINE